MAGDGPPDRAAPRRSGRRQGHHRHRGHADRDRLRPLRRAHPVARRDRGLDAAGGGRGDHGQDRHHGVRGLRARQDAEPAQPRPHPGRILERVGRRGGGGHGAGRARQPDQRLRDPPRVVLRRLRVQADARAHPPPRGVPALPHARHRGRLRPDPRRRRAARRAAGRVRRARPRLPAPRAHPVPRRGGRGAAADADVRPRPDVALGSHRSTTRGRRSRSSPTSSATAWKRSS